MKTGLLGVNPRKILVRSTNWIGDAIITTPAVRTIRENFPDAKISMLVHPWVADVFSASPHVDEIIHYYKKTHHKGLAGMWQLGRELSGKFDMAILLQNAFEAAFITKIAGIPVRVGYNRDCRGLLLTHPVPIDKEIKKIHQVHYYQHMLEELGLKPGENKLFLQVNEADQEYAAQLVEKIKRSGPVIGLNPGAAYGPAKRWPAEKYAELAAKLCEKYDAAIMVFGTNDDNQAAQTVSNMCSNDIADLTGKTTLGQAIACIQACTAFVTNDSGLMHVGAALATSLVAIFGSTNPVTTGPFSDNSVVVRKELACSPCLKTHCKTDFECMEGISVEVVIGKVETLLGINSTKKEGKTLTHL